MKHLPVSLHVNIYDLNQTQYTISEAVISRPPPPTESFVNNSDLVFNYDASPFAFWITRRSEPDSTPLFDTRAISLPQTPIPPVFANDSSSALDGFNLVFEDRYLQLTSALPRDTNVYGLGEYYSAAGFRRRIVENGGSIQTMWARNVADPLDQNMYGAHPFYLEHRYNESTHTSSSHGVFLMSSSGGDIMLLTPPNAAQSLIQYRMIGGTLDLYFFSGPDPKSVVEQYGEMIGLPTWQPLWGFGFHLCRWGYHDLNETKQQVESMRAADIPLEVMWNDIDMYDAYRDFTLDPGRFPADDVRSFIRELASNDQKYIPIVDAALAKQVNDTDLYDPYLRGKELDVFLKNPDGTEYVGAVWPGYTVFPDWFANDTLNWWTESLQNWSDLGVEYSGIWLDMNEIASFCNGSCGTGQKLSNIMVPPKILPGEPTNLVTAYPECYDSTRFGPSGNITVNGTLTCQSNIVPLSSSAVDLKNLTTDSLDPPYAIHNGNGALSISTLATNATHAGEILELYVHNMWGMMEEKTTHLALERIQPGKRPFLISRSTFPSAGKWTGHWLGDNFSKWQYMYLSIQGVLQFQLFQIPFAGADSCGFYGNTDEELCNRWMQLSAFTPFYRNHNERGAISQEPYRWESVANASRVAISARYSLLPYWYTLFANASLRGTPPMRALFFEFPEEPEIFALDKQFMVGRDIMVTPVFSPNATTVEAIFPGRGQVVWRDFWTHAEVNTTSTSSSTVLSAPLGHINVHVRDGSAILMHAEPGYTTEETRQGPFALLVSLSRNGRAFGSYYLDDGISNPPGPSSVLDFTVSGNQLRIDVKGQFQIEPKLRDITILGVAQKPDQVELQNSSDKVTWHYNETLQRLVVSNLTSNLNAPQMLNWA